MLTETIALIEDTEAIWLVWVSFSSWRTFVLRLQCIMVFSLGIFYTHPIPARRMRHRSSPSCSRSVYFYNVLSLVPSIRLFHSHWAFYRSCYRNTSPLDTCSSLHKSVWFQLFVCALLATTPSSICNLQSAAYCGVSAPSKDTRCGCAMARGTTTRVPACTALHAEFDAVSRTLPHPLFYWFLELLCISWVSSKCTLVLGWILLGCPPQWLSLVVLSEEVALWTRKGLWLE